MSERTTIREVFAEVDPDPDAILEAAGVDSPVELVESGGEHDPSADDPSADEDSVDELLEALEEGDSNGARDGERSTADSTDDRVDESAAGFGESLAGTADAIGGPSVTVVPGDGAVIDEVLRAGSTTDDSRSGRELSGGPTVTRVPGDESGGS
ncbi:hypothetical protein [Halosolutus gelatinilyticus]|uniref:hypothetical protein n=1 Tax=Halosolutus gelatinilyticus TaxID=2931975 RepID=UPI001FF160D7|nr:hypothetical protein [Halosolutus gelatinilyticus]